MGFDPKPGTPPEYNYRVIVSYKTRDEDTPMAIYHAIEQVTGKDIREVYVSASRDLYETIDQVWPPKEGYNAEKNVDLSERTGA